MTLLGKRTWILCLALVVEGTLLSWILGTEALVGVAGVVAATGAACSALKWSNSKES